MGPSLQRRWSQALQSDFLFPPLLQNSYLTDANCFPDKRTTVWADGAHIPTRPLASISTSLPATPVEPSHPIVALKIMPSGKPAQSACQACLDRAVELMQGHDMSPPMGVRKRGQARVAGSCLTGMEAHAHHGSESVPGSPGFPLASCPKGGDGSGWADSCDLSC